MRRRAEGMSAARRKKKHKMQGRGTTRIAPQAAVCPVVESEKSTGIPVYPASFFRSDLDMISRSLLSSEVDYVTRRFIGFSEGQGSEKGASGGWIFPLEHRFTRSVHPL